MTGKIITVVALAAFLSGCYHTQITTGETPSTDVYEIEWASSWIGGLVPPDVVNAEQECANGVAIVETELSFLNMLVGALTFSIYTPMHITVTCATGLSAINYDAMTDAMLTIRSGSSNEDIRHLFQEAANKSYEKGRPVYIALK